MDTTNSSEKPQRRVEDRKPAEVIDWAAPGAPAVPLSSAATSGDAPTDGWPSEIYLNTGEGPLEHFSKYDEVDWCDHPQGENDVRYVRAAVSAATKPTADLPDEQVSPTEINHIGTVWGKFSRADMLWTFTPDQFQSAARAVERSVRSLLATKPASEQTVPEGWMLVPKQFVTEVRRAAEIADSYSPSIDSIDEHGGEECEEPIWQIHHILYYAHAKLFGARAEYRAPTAAPADQVRNEALEEAARVCDSMGGEIDVRNVDEGKLCANSLAHEIRALKSAATQTTEGAGNA